MKPLKNSQTIYILILISGTILLAGIILSTDFLYAAIQEYLVPNIDPGYTPSYELANRILIASSLTITFGLVAYILITWITARTEKKKILLEEGQIIDKDGSLNFKALQFDISNAIKVLRDLFAYLIIIVVILGLFGFLRFIWIFSKYRAHEQLFIVYFLTNFSSMIISVTLYIALGFMVNYIIITSIQKYTRMQLLAKSFDNAMDKAWKNFARLMYEEVDSKKSKK